jgi:hypothetical protein
MFLVAFITVLFSGSGDISLDKLILIRLGNN